MSSSSRVKGENLFDFEEILHIRTRYGELRKEKDLLKESQGQGFQLIRELELHINSLSKARAEDKKQIKEIRKELMNCSHEIEYLQDQLNGRNLELNNLVLKLEDIESMHDKLGKLTVELGMSELENLLLKQEIEHKEVELQESALYIEKLEESTSSAFLESQCEIEIVKLDMMTLEHNNFDTKKNKEETIQEKDRMNMVIKDLEDQLYDARGMITRLQRDNRQLREKLALSETNSKVVCQKLDNRLDDKDSELERKLVQSKETSTCKDISPPYLSELIALPGPDAESKEKIESLLHQIRRYELFVKQLKEEVREEKLKAKEEAEDLTQEMAELRYRLTSLLEDECKRRGFIERTSLQRIADLEAQIKLEAISDKVVSCWESQKG